MMLTDPLMLLTAGLGGGSVFCAVMAVLSYRFQRK